MRTRFETNDEGDLEWYLGVRYSHSNDGGTLTASQASYIQKIGETYGGEKWISWRRRSTSRLRSFLRPRIRSWRL
eukprot:3022544-Rhodomonas_salina.1